MMKILNLFKRLRSSCQPILSVSHHTPILATSNCISSKKTYATKNDNGNEMTAKTLELAQAITKKRSTTVDATPNESILHFNQRRALSKAITLVESKSCSHIKQGDLLLNYLIETNSSNNVVVGDDNNTEKNERAVHKSFRIGIAGSPGAGKSSFIEKFGIYLLDELIAENKSTTSSEEEANENVELYKPNKLATLCIDPSSTLSGGSILGDKTRMTELSRHSKAFVRPSPSKGDLGGVSSHTNDVITLCQAAGFDLVLVETVGIGQSEVSVSQVVDMLILIVPPGGGDGLQGVKKGIMEVADLVIVNKADGDLFPIAASTAAEYKGATHFIKSRVDGWDSPPVLLASAITSYGFEEVWTTICKFRTLMSHNGELERRKTQQARYWMWKHVQDLISLRVQSDKRVEAMANDVQRALDDGCISPRVAASEILQCLDLTFYPKEED